MSQEGGQWGTAERYTGTPGGRGHSSKYRGLWWTIGIFALWSSTLLRSTLSNGDAATYLTQILELNPFLRTVHIGYFLTAMPLVHVLPGDPAWRLNLVSLLWSLAATVALWRLEAMTAPDGRASGWSIAWAAACPPVLAAATTAEVYPALIATELWALVLWGSHRPVAAATAWLLALTISPTALGLLPAFLLFRASGSSWRLLLFLTLAPFLLLVWGLQDDYLRGVRGVLVSPPGMGVAEAAWLRLTQTPTTFGLALLPIAGGIALAMRGTWIEGRRVLLAAMVHAIFVWVLFDRFRDVPAQALTLCMLSLPAAQGTRAWLKRPISQPDGHHWARTMLLAAFLAQALVADQTVRSVRRQEARFAALAQRVHTSLPDSGRVAAPFSTGRLYEWYAAGRTPAGLTVPLEALPGSGSRESQDFSISTPEFRLLSLPPPGSLPVGARLEVVGDGSWRYLAP